MHRSQTSPLFSSLTTVCSLKLAPHIMHGSSWSFLLYTIVYHTLKTNKKKPRTCMLYVVFICRETDVELMSVQPFQVFVSFSPVIWSCVTVRWLYGQCVYWICHYVPLFRIIHRKCLFFLPQIEYSHNWVTSSSESENFNNLSLYLNSINYFNIICMLSGSFHVKSTEHLNFVFHAFGLNGVLSNRNESWPT